jgi:Na+-driven multidrug efflux pump
MVREFSGGVTVEVVKAVLMFLCVFVLMLLWFFARPMFHHMQNGEDHLISAIEALRIMDTERASRELDEADEELLKAVIYGKALILLPEN